VSEPLTTDAAPAGDAVGAAVTVSPGQPGGPASPGPHGRSASALRARRQRRRHLMVTIVAPIVGLVVFFGGWQLWVDVRHVKPIVLPAPSRVFDHLWHNPGFYWRHARTTIWEASLGFTIALVIALVVATFMAHVPFLEKAILPIVVLIQVTPIIAYAPAIIIWLGFGTKPKVIIAALVCFVPFLVNAVAGFRSIDPNSYEVMRSVNASKSEIYWKLRFPQSLPYLFTAARIAVGLALIGAVLGEFFASTKGLGWTLKTAQARILVDQLWASIFVLAFIGVVAMVLIGIVERRVLRWHYSQNQ
jgi:NitT/TauT family transport system permease protein